MAAQKNIRLVDDEVFEEYPISVHERLDSHYFLIWNVKRWMASNFRREAYSDPEVGFYGRELFDIAQGETPVGTLPKDDEALAFCLRLPLEKWLSLRKRDLSPMYGWRPVRCDNGEIRMAHKVVTEVALEALKGKRRNAAKNADERMRKRLAGIIDNLKNKIPGGSQIAASDERVNQISDWIEAQYPGCSATVNRIREALNAL